MGWSKGSWTNGPDTRLPVHNTVAKIFASLAELAYAPHLKRGAFGIVGSTPTRRTKFMTIAEYRKNDPVIRQMLLSLIARNVQHPEIDAIEKILIEGVDGRFLVEMEEFPEIATP